ncbi:MAG: IS110 family transposase [Acidimicrobiia bacterium]
MAKRTRVEEFEELIERCAGIDVGQAEVVVCARVPDHLGRRTALVESFGTTVPDLLALHDWLAGLGVTHVAMESTGVYWKSPYYLLEDDFEVLLVNAAHVKHVPGRKTDTIDAAWLALLLSRGLLRASFVPPPPIRELRDLTRYRKALINERSREVNRIHKTLEDAGVKLATVATDVMGVSGRDMMRALIGGQADPEVLAELARGKLRAKLPALAKALTARFRDHHRFLLGRMLAHVTDLEADIVALSERIEGATSPFAVEVGLLCSIPGVGRRSAEVILAEIGADMSRFATPGHLASWAGMCPGQRESAGKRGSAKTRKGSKWLRTALVESARAAARSKGTYLSERYRQVCRRRGDRKAIIAVGHEILIAAWRVLSTHQPYVDPGPDTLRNLSAEHVKRRALAQLRALGYQITIHEPAA